MTTMLKCQDLQKRYSLYGEEVVALASATAEFESGEWVAIQGYSGSGKSTLLKLLAGLLNPTNGDISFMGMSYRKIGNLGRCRIRRTRMGIVSQDSMLVSHLSALENIELVGQLTGRPYSELREKASELLNRLGVYHRRTHLPRQLSGGERQRVSICRALMVDDAAVLIADEPTSNLDSENASTIAKTFRDLADSGLCIISASHDERILSHADKCWIIEDGVLDSASVKKQLD